MPAHFTASGFWMRSLWFSPDLDVRSPAGTRSCSVLRSRCARVHSSLYSLHKPSSLQGHR
jgi:hypothetical protein